MKKYRDPLTTFNLFQLVVQETSNLQFISRITNNPLLFLRKMLPETNSDLLFLESPLKPLRILVNFLKFPIVWLFSRLTLFILNTIREVAKQDSFPESREFRYLFFTHLTHIEGNNIGTDGFLTIISQHEPIKQKSAQVFLSHESVRTELSLKRGDKKVWKVQRSIRLSKFVQILWRNDTNAVRMLLSAFLLPGLSINARLFLSAASIRQLDRSCVYDEIIFENCANYVKRFSPRVFIVTYEGHTFEINTISKLQNTFPKLIILAYQHAPIVKSQFGFFQGLSAFKENVHLLTTGEIPRQLVLSQEPQMHQNVHVVGSNKYLLDELILEETISKQRNVLIAPEASLHATLELLSEFRKIANNNMKIVWIRLHPRANDPYLRQAVQRLYPDIKISGEVNLKLELSTSKICVFRSSALGIQGMQFGVIPIFCSSFPNTLLNPLYPVTQLAEYRDLEPLLEEMSDIRKIDFISDRDLERIKEVGIKYFSKPSSKKLDWITQL